MKSTHRSWCVDFLYTAIIHPFVRTNKQSTPTYPALKNKVLYRTKGICRFSQARTLGRASPFSTARANLGFFVFPFVRTNEKKHPKRVLSCFVTLFKNKVLVRTKGICRFSQARTLGRAAPSTTARANLGFFVFPFVRTNEKKHPKRVLSLVRTKGLEPTRLPTGT